MLTVGSLFSGIGALDLGLIRTGGFHVAYHVEKEAYCQRVLKRHWPDTTVYGDIRDCYGEGAVEPRTHFLPYVDTLVGGFPCTDISTSGRQEGIEEGKESGLWREFARLISELRPRYVVVENVAALRSPSTRGGIKRKPGLGRVLGDLAAFGYDAEWHCLLASAFDAPHRRDRVFIVAYRDGVGWDDRRDHRGERHIHADQERDAAQARANGQQLFAKSGENGQSSGMAYASVAGAGMEIPYATRQRWKHTDTPQPALVRRGDGEVDAEGVGAGSPTRGYSEKLEDATGQRLARAELFTKPDGISAWVSDTSSARMADTDSIELQEWERLREDDAAQCASLTRGSALAGIGTETQEDAAPESRLGRDADGLTSRLDEIRGQYRWPARPGENQYGWEPHRVVQGAYSDRVARIKALGNAVVVAVGQFVGEMVLDIDRRKNL
jgi:DNA-cytosine methyltransferase